MHFAGVVVDRPVLSIDHGGGVISSYEPVLTTLVEGDVVTRGDVIGTVLPGHCASVCVHLGVRVDGQYVSPLRFLGGIPRAILLPTRALEPGAKAICGLRRDASAGARLGRRVTRAIDAS